MYSWEIEKFLKDRNYTVGGDDLINLIDTRKNPQLSHIEYNAGNGSYDMWDKEGNHYHFSAIPYNEAKEKGLVKRKEDDWER